jgi:transposase
LLPEAVDDYVGADDPVRFIDAFVASLDLQAAGFARVTSKATGRPGYAPGDLLKLYIYGYLNRVRSSRRLEAEANRNIEVLWLLGGLNPDFKTIADFRSVNRAAFKSVFRDFVLLCRRLDLFGRELLAIDGTRIKAVNNKDRNFTEGSLQKFIAAADKKLEDYLNRLDAGDMQERTAGGSRVKNLAEKIAALKKKRGEYAAHLSALDKERRKPDFTHRSRQPRHGGAYESWRRLQCANRGRCQTQDDRRAGGDERCSGHGLAATDR